MITPPLNGLILPGITRDSILTLAKQWNDFKVTESTITMQDVCKLIQEERVSFAKPLFHLKLFLGQTVKIIFELYFNIFTAS